MRDCIKKTHCLLVRGDKGPPERSAGKRKNLGKREKMLNVGQRHEFASKVNYGILFRAFQFSVDAFLGICGYSIEIFYKGVLITKPKNICPRL